MSAADQNGLAVFELLRSRRHDDVALLCPAISSNSTVRICAGGRSWRAKPVLARLLRGAPAGVALNAHYEAAGAIVYQHACVLGCESIVSKRLGSPHSWGRVHHWLKVKNPAAPAVARKAEEEWN
jgi:hypothetical protein